MGLIWEFRLALSLPRPLIFGAFIFVICFSSVYLGFQWLFNLSVDPHAIGYGFMIACGLVVFRYYASSMFELTLDESGAPDSDHTDSEIQALYLPRNKIRQSRLAGLAGVLMLFVVVEATFIINGDTLMGPWIRLHDRSATLILNLLIGWLGGRLAFFSIIAAISQQTIPTKSEVDLLNLENLYAIGRRGLPYALIWLIGIAFGVLFMPINWGSGWWATIPIFAVSLAVGLAALFGPVREVRVAIRTVKQEELARLEPLVRQARDDALTEEASMQGRLTDLLAYQKRIKSTSEWPFDSPTLLRLGLYVLLPVISMVVGALVDRLIENILG